MGKKSFFLAFCFLFVLALLAGFGGSKQESSASESTLENEKSSNAHTEEKSKESSSKSTSDFKVTLLGTGLQSFRWNASVIQL